MITMSLSANYKTQSAAWDKLLLRGPLTDRRINALIDAGYYGKDMKEKRAAKRQRQRQNQPVRKLIEELLS